MAYELHIERVSHGGANERLPISLAERKLAFSTIKGARLSTSANDSIVNPKTGEVIGLSRRDGDAEVYFPEEKIWAPVFRWFEGRAHFNAMFNPGDNSHPAWRVATALASQLNASVLGDDGERYDLQTGKLDDA